MSSVWHLGLNGSIGRIINDAYLSDKIILAIRVILVNLNVNMMSANCGIAKDEVEEILIKNDLTTEDR